MSKRSIVILGSGPGIGQAVAVQFAKKGHTTIILVARRQSQLEEDAQKVKEANSEAKVHTIQADFANLDGLPKLFAQIDEIGPVECVYYNAAKVALSKVLEAPTSEMQEDYTVSCLALYEIAQWSLPKLAESGFTHPSLLVTNSLLYKEPNHHLFILSMVKSAQRSMVLSLNNDWGSKVHIGLVSVGSQVSPENPKMSPSLISQKAYDLFSQEKGQWKLEVEILE